MSGPHDNVQLRCPACPSAALREFHGRLCCDACQGMQLSLEELGRAIRDLSGVDPSYEFIDPMPGKRLCPRCRSAMTTSKLEVTLEGKVAKPRAVLDRCDLHGLWFDRDELAQVLHRSRAKVSVKGSAVGWPGGQSGIMWWEGLGRTR